MLMMQPIIIIIIIIKSRTTLHMCDAPKKTTSCVCFRQPDSCKAKIHFLGLG